jgi:hypothetical protein
MMAGGYLRVLEVTTALFLSDTTLSTPLFMVASLQIPDLALMPSTPNIH